MRSFPNTHGHRATRPPASRCHMRPGKRSDTRGDKCHECSNDQALLGMEERNGFMEKPTRDGLPRGGGFHDDSVMRRGQVGLFHREGKAPAKHSGRKSRVQDGGSRPARVSTSPGKL